MFVLSGAPASAAEMSVYRALLAAAVWKSPAGRDYHTADVTTEIGGVKRAFFLRLLPGGSIHRHVDAGDCRTDHVVMSTNDRCMNCWDGGEVHMQQGWRYSVDRTVVHWAVNRGGSERVHLLVEY